MTAPVISVLMTVYQGARYLPDTLESILTQTFGDFEFLVVDDGSTDGTTALLDEAAARDGRLSVQHNPSNQGITRSMNRLFPLARGRYVTRHDADDLSAPDRFARQAAFLDANPNIGLVSSQIGVIGSDGARLPTPRFVSGNDNQSIQETLYDYNCLCQGSVMFRRACREAVGLYDETLELSEDYDFWLRLAEVTQLVKLPTELYLYRDHPGSVSHLKYGQQVLHKAIGLDKALTRRFGGTPPARLAAFAARDYLEAAVNLRSSSDSVELRQGLAGVLRHRPDWFASDAVHIPIPATPAGDQLAREVFAANPALPHGQRQLERFLARQYMREVFAGARRHDWAYVSAHLGRGLRYGPRWLLNRGVWVLIVKTLAWWISQQARPTDHQPR